MSLSADQTVEALRAAGEPTRLRILSLLAGEELSVMEMSRILDQSQPRVSRHLKLMTDAGLIERFPDGARVYYRLSHDAQARRLIDTVLDILAEDAGEADHRRLDEVRRDREEAAVTYFEQIAPQWDRLRSLYVSETAVEAALERAIGPGPFDRVVDLGTGSGRMLTLFEKAFARQGDPLRRRGVEDRISAWHGHLLRSWVCEASASRSRGQRCWSTAVQRTTQAQECGVSRTVMR